MAMKAIEMESQRRSVYTYVQFVNMGSIDFIHEIYRSNIIIKSSWIDEKKIDQYDPQKHWNPRLYVENGQTIPTVNWIENVTYETRTHLNGTRITEIRDITGDFWERMELYDFPLDIQELSVTICSWHEKGSVKILPHPEIKSYIHPRAYNCFQEQQKYKLQSYTFSESNASYVSNSEYKSFTEQFGCENESLSCGVVITRKVGFFLANNFLIVLAVTILSLTIFSIEPENISSRLSNIFVLILTMLTYKVVTSSQLPTISYLTIIDKYQLANIGFLAATAFWMAILNVVVTDATLKKQYDQIFFLVAIGLIVLINIWISFYISKAYYKIIIITRKNKEFEGDKSSIDFINSLSYFERLSIKERSFM